jgi:hypothetical protein
VEVKVRETARPAWTIAWAAAGLALASAARLAGGELLLHRSPGLEIVIFVLTSMASMYLPLVLDRANLAHARARLESTLAVRRLERGFVSDRAPLAGGAIYRNGTGSLALVVDGAKRSLDGARVVITGEPGAAVHLVLADVAYEIEPAWPQDTARRLALTVCELLALPDPVVRTLRLARPEPEAPGWGAPFGAAMVVYCVVGIFVPAVYALGCPLTVAFFLWHQRRAVRRDAGASRAAAVERFEELRTAARKRAPTYEAPLPMYLPTLVAAAS